MCWLPGIFASHLFSKSSLSILISKDSIFRIYPEALAENAGTFGTLVANKLVTSAVPAVGYTSEALGTCWLLTIYLWLANRSPLSSVSCEAKLGLLVCILVLALEKLRLKRAARREVVSLS